MGTKQLFRVDALNLLFDFIFFQLGRFFSLRLQHTNMSPKLLNLFLDIFLIALKFELCGLDFKSALLQFFLELVQTIEFYFLSG